MKKISCLVVSVLLLVGLFTGCKNNDGLSIRICGYSDSIPENPHKLEFKDWSKEAFVDGKAEKSVAFSFGNIEVAGSYVETEKRFSEFYETHKYKDEENRYFSLTDDGNLCTYFFGKSTSEDNGRIHTEAECIETASVFLSSITDVSQYTVTASFDENRRMYTISFIKYADGFRCSDRADVMIEETGHIYSFSSTMLGRIQSDVKTNFDPTIIQEQVVSKLDTEYSGAKQAYDEVTYESFDYELTIGEDGEYALICSVDVKCVHSYDGYDGIVFERIMLLIQ